MSGPAAEAVVSGPAVVQKNCAGCKASMTVRVADRNRGWGKFCSKSCKAKHQTKQTGIAGPHYKAGGKTVQQMANGHYAKSAFAGGGKPRAPKNGIFRDGKRVCCEQCGAWATNGVESILAHHPIDPVHGYRIEWTCDLHFDDTHPFDSEGLGQW